MSEQLTSTFACACLHIKRTQSCSSQSSLTREHTLGAGGFLLEAVNQEVDAGLLSGGVLHQRNPHHLEVLEGLLQLFDLSAE